MLIAPIVLFVNEGSAVQTEKSLAEGAGAVVSVTSTTVDPTKEGRLVHTSGPATTAETLSDPEFGVSVKALSLERRVEVYQWVEHRRGAHASSLSNRPYSACLEDVWRLEPG